MNGTLVSLLLLFASGTSAAADIYIDNSLGVPNVVLEGEIAPGDAQKFLQSVRSHPRSWMQAATIRLNSPGGMVSEGLKLAKLIEISGLMARVEEGGTCASACFLLFASSQFRSMHSKSLVLLHRPYNPAHRTDIDGYSQDREDQQSATRALRSYLEDRSISSTLVDAMMQKPSGSAYRLSLDDLRNKMGFLSPSLEELTQEECGLTNENIFSRSRNFGSDPNNDDLSCIRKFTIALKFDFVEAVIGKKKFNEVFDTL